MHLIQSITLFFLILPSANAFDWTQFTEKWSQDPVINSLKSEYPRIYWDILSASSDEAAKDFWGIAVNFDENANAIVIKEPIIKLLTKEFRVPEPIKVLTPNERILVHSGIQHTYAYLFSNLVTPYGYKRARWIDESIDHGLGFTEPTIHPTPKKGSLFYNVTTLAAKIAGIKLPKKVINKSSLNIRNLNLDPKRRIRIQEIIQNPKRTTLYTDLYLFDQPEKNPGAILTYSILSEGMEHPKLITVFPVESSFIKMITTSKNWGKNQKILLRYNAYIDGLYQNNNLKGERTLYYGKNR